MAYDATKMQDMQISEASEANMSTPDEWREKLGLQKDEMLPYGRIAKLDFLKIIDRLKELERLDDYEKLAPIKDWSTERAGGPRKVIREDVRE